MYTARSAQVNCKRRRSRATARTGGGGANASSGGRVEANAKASYRRRWARRAAGKESRGVARSPTSRGRVLFAVWLPKILVYAKILTRNRI